VRLLQHRPRGGYLEHLFDQALARTRLSPADRHLCQELVYGIVRWQATLDWLVARKAGQRPQKPLIQNLLRLGLYQLFWLDRIPHHAAVNETVQLAGRSGLGPQAGFLNAVLRAYVREFDATRRLLAQLKVSDPPLGLSHPAWLAARWTQRWGAQRAAQLMEWNNTPPATFARLNTLKTDSAGLLAQWRKEGVQCLPVRRDWLADNLVFELKSHPPLARLPSFRHGLFYVQDPGTLLAPQELDPRPGQTVLDLCAAPGGKLTYLAQLMANHGELFAHETAPQRLKLIHQNCARLGLTCVKFFNPETPALFDRILLDVPCSNTGVMRRRVELRWRLRPQELERLRATQLQLLRQAAGRLRPGGRLVYSTCSLETEENQEVIAQFLSEHPAFQLERQRELLPFEDKADGAFVANLSYDKGSRA
jgi:16S rRNA (cytosine967-C5)-methyltransferase